MQSWINFNNLLRIFPNNKLTWLCKAPLGVRHNWIPATGPSQTFLLPNTVVTTFLSLRRSNGAKSIREIYNNLTMMSNECNTKLQLPVMNTQTVKHSLSSDTLVTLIVFVSFIIRKCFHELYEKLKLQTSFSITTHYLSQAV